MNKLDKRVLRMIQDFESGNYEPENEEEIDRVYEAVDILRRYARLKSDYFPDDPVEIFELSLDSLNFLAGGSSTAYDEIEYYLRFLAELAFEEGDEETEVWIINETLGYPSAAEAQAFIDIYDGYIGLSQNDFSLSPYLMPSYRKVPCILARFDKENKQYIILNKEIEKILGEDFKVTVLGPIPRIISHIYIMSSIAVDKVYKVFSAMIPILTEKYGMNLIAFIHIRDLLGIVLGFMEELERRFKGISKRLKFNHESEEVRKLVSDFITQKVKHIRKSCTRSSMLTKIFLRRKERHGEGDFETEMLKEGFRVVYYGEE